MTKLSPDPFATARSSSKLVAFSDEALAFFPLTPNLRDRASVWKFNVEG